EPGEAAVCRAREAEPERPGGRAGAPLPRPARRITRMPARPHPIPLAAGLAGIAAAVLLLLAVGLGSAGGKPAYDLVRDLFVPLVGPLVAVLIPVVLFYVIPRGQTRQKLALDLCAQYYTEEMRD